MTDEEKQLLLKLGDCWNDFSKLKDKHPSDGDDFMYHIHALQRMVFARVGARSIPEITSWMNK
jgi:hypothetical protein